VFCTHAEAFVQNSLTFFDQLLIRVHYPRGHGRPQGGKGICPLPRNWDWEGKNSGKREISSLILISWVNSCNDSLFADMTLTLHKSQVHCFGNMQLWDCSSIRFACRGRLRNSWANCLLRNNNTQWRIKGGAYWATARGPQHL